MHRRWLAPVLVEMVMWPLTEQLLAVHQLQAADHGLHCKHGYR